MTIPVSLVQASVFSLHVLSVNILSQRRAAALLQQQQDFSCQHVNITKPVVSHAGNKELCRARQLSYRKQIGPSSAHTICRGHQL